jgi:large subunit ribosomal protein L18
MIKKVARNEVRQARHARVRKTVSGSSSTPRLNVFRSNGNIFAQIIDDEAGKTLVSASSIDKELKLQNGGNVEAATKVGELIAKRAKKAKIETVIFDRGGYLYHGRVKALAEAARENGLKF